MANTHPTPKNLDHIDHLGGVDFLHMDHGVPAILRNNKWIKFPKAKYDLVYLGPTSDNKANRWRVEPKSNSEDKEDAPSKDGKTGNKVVKPVAHQHNFSVKVTLNKETHSYDIKAYSEKQAKFLALDKLSKDLKMIVPAIRNRLLPDAWSITQTS